jgi:hypothetical protein
MDAVMVAESLSMRTRRARSQDAYAIYRLVHGHSNDGTLPHRFTADKAVQDNAMKHNEVKSRYKESRLSGLLGLSDRVDDYANFWKGDIPIKGQK